MAAAQGNQYASRAAVFRAAITRALEEKSRVAQVQALDQIAADMIDAALDKEASPLARLPIWKELADRLDGKPKQQTEVTGADGAPLVTSIAVEFARASAGKG
jgi:Arc/MetJ-type ribon-helix-helix transcriptional regulator